MAEFQAITTQEDFDRAIQARLDRQERSIRAQFADYDALKEANGKYDEQIKKLNQDLADANAKIRKGEIDSLKAKVALETGLPAELQARLSGETEEDIRKDAKTLSEIFKASQRQGLPGFSGEKEPSKDPKEAALRGFLKTLRNE